MDLTPRRDDAPDERSAPKLPFGLITLEQAADAVGVSRQGIVGLLEQAGIPIQRIPTGAGNISAVDRADLQRLRPSAGGLPPSAAAPATDLLSHVESRLRARSGGDDRELNEMRERLRQVQTELAEARAELQLAERASEQLERLHREATEAQSQILELTRTIGSLETSLARSEEKLRARDEELADVRRRANEERDTLATELDAERRKSDAADEDLRGAAALGSALEQQLQLARQVEAANQAYLDRIEEKLTAARHTADHLLRKRA